MQRLSGGEAKILVERRVRGEIELALHMERCAFLDVDGAVVPQLAVTLVEADERGDVTGGRGRGRGIDRRLAVAGAERVAAELELGEDDELRVMAAGFRTTARAPAVFAARSPRRQSSWANAIRTRPAYGVKGSPRSLLPTHISHFQVAQPADAV